MEIIALGHSGFRLRAKEATVVIDPPAPAFGFPLKGVTADIVCVTHDHPGHNFTAGISGEPYVVRGPGEYEIRGVLISALRTFHDDKHGAERGGNTVYVIHIEDLLVAHLGDLGHPLNAAQQEEVAGADILMIPVGGHATINAKMAAELISELEPTIIIPMHYAAAGAHPAGSVPLDPVETFFQAMGVPIAEPLPKLVVTRNTLPPQLQVTLLAPRG